MAKDRYALGIDLGTGGVKVGLVRADGALIAKRTAEISTHHPNGPLSATQDPKAWWASIVDMTRSIVEEFDPKDALVAICATGQWASTVPVDAAGDPVGECLLWMDESGASYSESIIGGKFMGYNPLAALTFIRKTGGAPSRSGADPIGHINYIEQKLPEIAAKTSWYLEPVDFISMKLTGIAAATHASMTASWLTDNTNLDRYRYDERLVRLSRLPLAKLPRLIPVGSVIGKISEAAAKELHLDSGANVITGLPDLHTGAIGSGSIDADEVHLCLSTTAWISAPTSKKKTDIYHSIASVPGIFPGEYLIANNHETAGESLDWFRDNFFDNGSAPLAATSFSELDRLSSRSSPGSNGVVFTPWLAGERSPVDDKNARAAFIGLSLATTRADLTRSVLEGVALSNRWLMEPFVKFKGGGSPDKVRIIGGGANSDLWCQIHADVLKTEVHRIKDPIYANLKGAGLMALFGNGTISRSEIKAAVEIDRIFFPHRPNEELLDGYYEVFSKIYKRHKPLFRLLAPLRSWK